MTKALTKDLIDWLIENQDQEVELTEPVRVRLFGAQGKRRMDLMHRFLIPFPTAELNKNSERRRVQWKRARINRDAVINALQKAKNQAAAAMMTGPLQITEVTGLDPIEAMQLLAPGGLLSAETQQLLTDSRSRWSDETLLLSHEVD
jgi:hypothetical protein